MRTLYVFDDQDYHPEWERFSREAVRAVILKNHQIALVQSKTDGFFKFPGGGIETGESHFDALVRETREETGLTVIPASIAPLGLVQEVRKSIYDAEIFQQKSYYYYAQVESTLTGQALDDYEKDLGFELVWSDVEAAYHRNLQLGEDGRFSFLLREAAVLGYLLDHCVQEACP